MIFSSSTSDPRAFQRQLSAVHQQQQLMLQRPSVSVSGSTTCAASSASQAASPHQRRAANSTNPECRIIQQHTNAVALV
jgi:hypothetical protein